jgi:diaminopimelate epimerase
VSRAIDFVKMQGLGNDFIVVEGPAGFSDSEVQELCDRRFGVGADGILVVTRGDPVKMEYWNADGSAAEMCGNGLRCVARYAHDQGWVRRPEFLVDTPVGTRRVSVTGDLIRVELGPVAVGGHKTVEGLDLVLVDVGNPHGVAFVDDPQQVPVAELGAAIEADFPDGLNVEFVRYDGQIVEMRVWERGVGETLACGTGMAAAVVAATGGGTVSPVTVRVPGGTAQVEISDGIAWLTGPAEYSFRGSVGSR